MNGSVAEKPGRNFDDMARSVARWTGRPTAFAIATAGVVFWAVSGPYFHFSNTWELIINTVTTVITFLMVFVIQNSQNRDNKAIQLKLDELIRVTAARNSIVASEDKTEAKIDEAKQEIVDAVNRSATEERLRSDESAAELRKRPERGS